jgi:hypothetical protein
MKAHWSTKQETEVPGGDPAKTDTEGTPDEDRWFGAGSHGWYDHLMDRLRRKFG